MSDADNDPADDGHAEGAIEPAPNLVPMQPTWMTMSGGCGPARTSRLSAWSYSRACRGPCCSQSRIGAPSPDLLTVAQAGRPPTRCICAGERAY